MHQIYTTLCSSQCHLSRCPDGWGHCTFSWSRQRRWQSGEESLYEVDLDFDGSEEDAASGGDACYHSFLKFVFDGNKHSQLKGIVKGGGSNSGGGFTNGKMKEELVRKGLANENEYIHCPCTLHNDQTNLRNATESIFGEGGIEKRNVMQLLHALSDFQNDFSDKDLYLDLLEAAHRDKFPDKATVPKDLLRLMQEPIATRWKTIGMAARYIHKHFAVLVHFVRAVCDVKRTHSYRNKCGSNFLALANEPVIKCDLALLAGFDKIYFNHHMEFNHTTDKIIGRSGFLAPHHPVQYFLKVSELQELEEEVEKGALYINQTPKSAKLPSFWQAMRDCEGLVEIEAQIDCARKFLEVYKGSLHKHNKHFCNKLLFLGCFGEQPTATIVANYLIISSLGNDPSVEDLMEGQKRRSSLPCTTIKQLILRCLQIS
ncbi:unnamed protein product [Cylindrotheca closterium]|uniref:Uncharacterized protein n=1 Tax=Cylindrotheca closterium TaxID=2856 RepID=A0AAD2CLH8_9STRA|nr:unnamed protein product [Cylindrotheca closterium]